MGSPLDGERGDVETTLTLSSGGEIDAKFRLLGTMDLHPDWSRS